MFLISFLKGKSKVVFVTEIEIVVVDFFFDVLEILGCFSIVIWFLSVSSSEGYEDNIFNLIDLLVDYSSNFYFLFDKHEEGLLSDGNDANDQMDIDFFEFR